MGTKFQKIEILKEKKDMLMNLPEEVLMQILVILPVKSLLCLRCVSKSLNSFVKNPYFINLHMKQQRECILITEYRSFLSFHSYESFNEIAPHMEIPHFNSKEFVDVSWPCNGLLVCVSLDTRSMVLCNLATREFKLLPPSPFQGMCSHVFSIGLGFDSNKTDYKVVTFTDKNSDYKFEVYNLSSNSWRQIDHDMPLIYTGNGIPSNGALNWIAKTESVDIIVSFNVSTEVFQIMDLPDSIAPHTSRIHKSPTIVNDSLALFAFSPHFRIDPKFIDIWVMKEGSWAKQVSIHGDMLNRFMCPRLLWKNEALLMFIRGSKLKVYNLDTQIISDTGIMATIFTLLSVMVYKESLVSIK